ncbi:MAG: recombination protein RecR [Chloroflexi bacterium RBG_16_50_11]|nr:MAG: recombination protein RecR [Chloroflexi bacterium RBG_16_50_11]
MKQDQVPATDAIGRLVQEFSKLPGIGPKSAQRITFYLLRNSEEQAKALAEALLSLKQRVNLCSVCCNVTESDPCPLCRSPQREMTQLCIVEQPQDIIALEHTGAYKGLYHVLHGAISPTEGIGADNIRIRELLTRLQDNTVKEVILATNTNLEGEQTAMYLSRVISPLGIKVTRLARGLPFGTELEYADDMTLTRAIEGRGEY